MARKYVALYLSAAASLIALGGGTLPMGQTAGAEVKPARADYPQHAPRLVEQALAADLAGNDDERAALLKRATDADADLASARWQLGELMFNGQWRTPAEVAKHVAADQRWQKYEALRSEAGDTVADHLRLAQWCMRNELAVEERYHWAKVLLANPAHQLARQRLKVQEHQGRLQTREQVAAEKERREQAERDLARFKPKFVAWCREATSDLKVNRAKALAKIRAIDDPAAIPALREAVRRAIDTTAGKRHRSELILAMTAALTNMPHHAATLNLLDLAIYSSIPEVRQAAAEALRPRPATDYVPPLMQMLQAPLEVAYDLVAAPDGMVRMVETVYEQKPMFEVAQVRTTNFEVEGALGRDKAKTDVGAVLNRHLNAASSRAVATQSEIDAANAAAADRNQRVQAALKIAMGMEAPKDDVAAWWRAWQTYNELEYEVPETVYESNYDETYSFFYEQGPPPTVALNIPEPPTTSCFAPGTLVWKQSGPTPIEQIRVGDMVLAQHPTTGELAYRPVLEKTVGKMTPVLRVKLADDEIVTTLGHRFWVEGSGWEMAKDLPAARSLHALQGGLAIESVDPAGEMECHNLEVDDFHTFVIGKSQVLVHDKTCPQPTLAVTPGLADPKFKRDSVRAATEFVSAAAD
jgi:hypothetical protein